MRTGADTDTEVGWIVGSRSSRWTFVGRPQREKGHETIQNLDTAKRVTMEDGTE